MTAAAVPARAVPTDWLDPKQREVLERAADGQTGAETGRAMGYSQDGIKIIRRDVLRILGARNMTHAVALDRARTAH